MHPDKSSLKARKRIAFMLPVLFGLVISLGVVVATISGTHDPAQEGNLLAADPVEPVREAPQEAPPADSNEGEAQEPAQEKTSEGEGQGPGGEEGGPEQPVEEPREEGAQEEGPGEEPEPEPDRIPRPHADELVEVVEEPVNLEKYGSIL